MGHVQDGTGDALMSSSMTWHQYKGGSRNTEVIQTPGNQLLPQISCHYHPQCPFHRDLPPRSRILLELLRLSLTLASHPVRPHNTYMATRRRCSQTIHPYSHLLLTTSKRMQMDTCTSPFHRTCLYFKTHIGIPGCSRTHLCLILKFIMHAS